MKKTLLILALGSGLFVSCKKEEPKPSDNTTPMTTTQKIQQKWNLSSVIDIEYIGSSTTIDNIDTLVLGAPGDYADFRADNKVYISVTGEFDTLPYSILSDSKIVFDDQLFDISKLTTSQFEMKFSERIDTPYYDEIINFKR
jgi:hypothetical protein